MSDRIVSLIEKYKPIIRYIVTGIATTLINWGVDALCFYVFRLSNVASTIIAWVAAILFSFAVNKVWVFTSRSWEINVWIPEFFKFVIGRLGTFVFETGFMWATVDLLHGFRPLMKILCSVVVMVLNYILGKFFAFNTNSKKHEI